MPSDWSYRRGVEKVLLPFSVFSWINIVVFQIPLSLENSEHLSLMTEKKKNENETIITDAHPYLNFHTASVYI